MECVCGERRAWESNVCELEQALNAVGLSGLEPSLNPLHNLHRIRTLKKWLRNSIYNGKKARNGLYTSISCCIFVLVNVTYIPFDLIAQIQKCLYIDSFTRLAPRSRESGYRYWDKRPVICWSFDQAFEELLAGEGNHLVRLGLGHFLIGDM